MPVTVHEARGSLVTRARLVRWGPLATLVALAAVVAFARGHGVDVLTERGLRLVAAARARDVVNLGGEAPLHVLAMAPFGPRVGIAFELVALATLFRVLSGLRVAPTLAAVALLPIALDPSFAAAVVSGEPAGAALLGFALLVAIHSARAGVFAAVGRSPVGTAIACALVTLLSFDLAIAALMIVIVRHPTRRGSLVAFVVAFVALRAALGSLVPPAITSEAALTARLPALARAPSSGRALAALHENVQVLSSTAAAFPAALGAAFFLVAVRVRGRACARALRLVGPVLGAALGWAIFLPFGAPSATRSEPLIAVLLLSSAIGLDAARGRVTEALALVVVVATAATRPPVERAAHVALVNAAGKEPAGPVLCGPCGLAWLSRSDLLPIALLDSDGRAAVREGALLAHARARGVVSVAVAPELLDDALLGARMREELHRDGAVFRVEKVTDDELLLSSTPLSLASARGAAHVGDGFALGPRGAESRAPRAELLFVTPPAFGAARLQLLMKSALHDEQPVDVLIDGVAVAHFDVGAAARWYDLPLGAARAGRSRIRLALPRARALARPELDAWRTADGRGVVSIVVERMALFSLDEPRLPPDGPRIDDPRFDRLLRAGFSPVERDAKPAGVWANGTAQIDFFLRGEKRPRVLRIEGGPPPFGDQSVSVTVNGVHLGDVRFPSSAISVRTIPFPVTAQETGENVMTLSFARVADGRTFYLRGLELLGAAP